MKNAWNNFGGCREIDTNFIFLETCPENHMACASTFHHHLKPITISAQITSADQTLIPQDMSPRSNPSQIPVLPSKSLSTTTSPPTPAPTDKNKGMKLSNIVIAGTALTATAVTGLQRPYSVELGTNHPDNESAIRRLRTVGDGNLTATIPGHPNVKTVYDLVRNAVDGWRDKQCLGSRNLVRTHEEEKQVTKFINGIEQQVLKKWVYSQLSPYEFRTYRDVGEESIAVGAGLRKLGLVPTDHIGIYADTWYFPWIA
jgi:hypothetical protein